MSKKNRKLKVVRTEDLTGWFDSTQRPAKPGVYEVKSHDGTAGQFYSKWDGNAWGYRYPTIEYANIYTQGDDPDQTRTWRGIQGD